MARIIGIDKLTFRDMMSNLNLYGGLSDGLIQLPCPDYIKIGRNRYEIPETMSDLANKLCYGQRLFLAREEADDIGLISRMMDGYYYPIVTGQKWDEEKARLLGNKVLTCKVKELYPVAMRIITLVSEITEREVELLHKDPTKIERAAGIEELAVFAELNSLDFLRDAMKITVPEVLLTPYNECLVRFMNAKGIADYQARYIELLKIESKTKAKFHEKA